MRLKRMISAALAVSMAVSMVPATAVTAFATDAGNSVAVQTAEESASNKCGENLTWAVSEDGSALTISGEGAMDDYSSWEDAPWAGNDKSPAIKNIILPEGLTHIGDNAFRYAGITSIEIPSTVTSIGYAALAACESNKSITVAQGNSVFYSDDGVLYENTESGKVLRFVPAAKTGELVIDDVVGIGAEAMVYSQVSSVEIPNTVKSIGDYALARLKNVESITIPASVEKLGVGVLQRGAKLAHISLLANVAEIPQRFAFSDEKLTAFEFPNNITTIGAHAFSQSGLTSVEIGENSNLKSIDSTAFSNCTALTKIDIETNGNLDLSVFAPVIDGGSPKDISIGSTNGTVIINNQMQKSSIERIRLFGKLDITLNGLFLNVACNQYDLSGVTEIVLSGNATNPFYNWRTNSKKPVIYVGNDSARGVIASQNAQYVIFAVTNGGTLPENTIFENGKLATPEKAGYTFKGWTYNNGEDVKIVDENTLLEAGKTYYAQWELTPVAATMTATTSKSAYLVNTPVDVNITVNPGTHDAEIFYGKVALTYGDEVEKVELNGKELTKKEYTVQELAQLMGLVQQSSDLKATLNVTYKKTGNYNFGVALNNADGDAICNADAKVVVGEKAADITPATKLYDLTIKNADVTIKNSDEELKTEKNDKGELTAKVPEGAEVTVTYTSQSDAVVFDQWTVTTDAKLDVDVKTNPLTFKMPADGVTIEAMTKDASIEEEPNVLGTAAVIGTAAVGTAVLAWQGYQLGTELYLKAALPAGAAIPTNRAELALLVWNNAGKPEPVAVLNADATETEKAIAWAVENELIPADKAAEDTVSKIDVIKAWNKAKEMNK